MDKRIGARHDDPAATDPRAESGAACEEPHEVPEEVAERVAATPGGAYEVPDEVLCGLELGHPGEHMSLLQAWGEREEWLVWSEPAVLPSAPCRPDGLTCLLPAGHPGRHHVILTDVVSDEGPFWCADRAEFDRLRAGAGSR